MTDRESKAMNELSQTRRSLLQSLGLAPLALAAPIPREAAKLTVTGLETFRLKVNHRGDWVIARLLTSGGIAGLGDASHGGADAETIALMRQYLERLKGRGVFDIEWLRQWGAQEIARRGKVAAVAISALEQSLWDIQGQAFGVPCYQLFGGQLRPSIRNYANINRSATDRSPAGFSRMAANAVATGFDAVKLAPFDGMPRDAAAREKHISNAVDCAFAVREAIGPQRELLIDVHSLVTLEQGLKLVESLAPLKLFWLEEVTREPLENLAAIRRAAQAVKMPIAGGESLPGAKAFYRYAAAGAADILMPDVKYCGGLLELRKVAALAEAMGLTIAPHGPASPIGNFAVAHVCAGAPNFHILEFSFGEVPWRAELVDPPERIERGHLALADRPGFGVALNPRVVNKYLV